MADADFRLEFRTEGFQRVLNSPGTFAMLDSVAGGVVARSHGLAYKRGFTATKFRYGPRPAVSVFANRSRFGKLQALANHLLEGAM